MPCAPGSYWWPNAATMEYMERVGFDWDQRSYLFSDHRKRHSRTIAQHTHWGVDGELKWYWATAAHTSGLFDSAEQAFVNAELANWEGV